MTGGSDAMGEARAWLSQLAEGFGGLEGENTRRARAILGELERLEEAAKLTSAYYAYHSEYGEVCPCDVCAKARTYFAALLKT